jgi:hypothetical protein
MNFISFRNLFDIRFYFYHWIPIFIYFGAKYAIFLTGWTKMQYLVGPWIFLYIFNHMPHLFICLFLVRLTTLSIGRIICRRDAMPSSEFIYLEIEATGIMCNTRSGMLLIFWTDSWILRDRFFKTAASSAGVRNGYLHSTKVPTTAMFLLLLLLLLLLLAL